MKKQSESAGLRGGLMVTASAFCTRDHCLSLICIMLSAMLTSCGDDKKPNSPGGPDWELGEATSYTVDSPGQTTIADSVTGQHFLFPEGGHGTLEVSAIISGPDAPYEGSGFNIKLDEELPIALVVDPTGTDQVMVMGYGTAPGLYDDIPGPSERWIAMPCVDSLESGLAFQLTLPFTGTRKAAVPNAGYNNYWISSIPAGSSDATRRVALELQSQEFVDDILGRLSPTRAAAARAEVDGRLSPHYAWDGFLYSGFWWRSLGSLGRIVRPTIHVRLTADAGNVAHETGHYLTHVLVGDDVYSTLEGQAPLWDNGHGIRDQVGRNLLVEDYAYFCEWLSVGSVKSYDLHEPYVIFGGLSPLTEDFPGTEGFAAVALASLTRTTPTIRNLISGQSDDIPVVGLSESQVFDIIAQGATGIEDLQARITTAVGSESDKLPAMFQRIGWRHSVKGRLLTPEGQPLVGATVSSVSLVGDHVYRGGSSSIPSGSDGRFTIVGQVFPGESNIRVWDGEDSIDVPITIPWSQETNRTFDLGDLRVEARVDLSALRICSIDLFTNANFVFPSGSQERYERIETGAVYGSFVGGQFTGEYDTTTDNVHETVALTAVVDTQSGELQTLAYTQTRVTRCWDEVAQAYADFTETVHFTFHELPRSSTYTWPPPRVVVEHSIFEAEVCDHISEYTFSGAGCDYSTEMTNYNCAPDHNSGYLSHLRVYFYSAL